MKYCHWAVNVCIGWLWGWFTGNDTLGVLYIASVALLYSLDGHYRDLKRTREESRRADSIG